MRHVPKLATASIVFATGVTLLASPPAGAAPTVSPESVDAAAVETTVLTVSTTRYRVGPNTAFEVRAVLSRAADASVLGGENVTLQWRRRGEPGWQVGPDAATDVEGRATWQVDRLTESRRFRVLFDGTVALAAATSDVVEVRLRPDVVVSASRGWVRPDGTVTLRARVRPEFGGELLTLQHPEGGAWRSVGRTRQDVDGQASFVVPGRPTFGLDRYRVVIDRSPGHLGSHSRVVEIRTVRVVTYVIRTRGKVASAVPSFRRRTAEIYADPRGWTRANVHFKRVRRGGDFSLVLSQARYLPSYDPICDRYWSCSSGRYVVINEDRWRAGTPYFMKSGGTLRQYRAMVVNHETGHWFGLGHAGCGGAGRPAPVMMQQSKGLYGCEPNAWPLTWEINLAY